MVEISPAHKFGLGVALACLLVINSPIFYQAYTDYSQPASVSVPMCAPSNTQPVKTDGAQIEISHDLGIPDYNVTVFLDSENTYSSGSEQIRLNVVDTGWFHLQTPYLYLLAFDPNGNLAFMFPCASTPSQTYFSGYSSPLLTGTTSLGKWQDLSIGAQTVNGVYSYCTTQGQVMVSGTCVTRNQLLSGVTSGGNPIVFTFPTSESGSWSIYAFIFDTTYQTRPNITYCQPYSYGQTCTPYFISNAVGAARSDFESSSGSPPSTGLSYTTDAQLLGSAVLAGVSYFFLGSEKVFPRVQNQWKLHRSSIKQLIVVMIVIAVFDFIVLTLLH